MWVEYMECWLKISPYSWTFMLPCLKFMNSRAFASFNSIGRDPLRKVSWKQSQVTGAASAPLFSYNLVYHILVTSFNSYDGNSTRSFPVTLITSKIFLMSSKKLWGSSLDCDHKNSGGFILAKSWTLVATDPPFSFTWAWTRFFWLVIVWANICMTFLKRRTSS